MKNLQLSKCGRLCNMLSGFNSRLLKFDIGDCPIEMKSDHAPLFAKLDFSHSNPHNRQALGIQKQALYKGKILINQEKQVNIQCCS